MYRHRFLSDAQCEAIETAHFDLDDREIARYWNAIRPRSAPYRSPPPRFQPLRIRSSALPAAFSRLATATARPRATTAPALRRRTVANPDRQHRRVLPPSAHPKRASARDHRSLRLPLLR